MSGPIWVPGSTSAPTEHALSLTGYFDESGTHAGSEAIAVAGFLATPAAWERFDVDWKAALTEFELAFWHMSEFAHGRGGFSGWPEPLRRERLGRMLGIIKEHIVGCVGNVIPLATYDHVFSPHGPARLKTGGAYGLAFAANVLSVASIVRHLRGEPVVDYVYESGAVGRHQVEGVFADNIGEPESQAHFRLGSLRFEDKRPCSPLQAADILAYELYRELPRQLAPDGRPTRHPLRELAALPRSWGWLDEDELKKWAYVMTMATHFGEGNWQL